MSFRSFTNRKKVSIIATITSVLLATTIFAPAGFGSSLAAALWEGEPVVLFVPPIIVPGEVIDCAIEFEGEAEEAEEPIEASRASDVSTRVTVFSNPPGVIEYRGFISDPSDPVSARVSLDAAPGPVTVYVKIGDSYPISSNTMVVPN